MNFRRQLSWSTLFSLLFLILHSSPAKAATIDIVSYGSISNAMSGELLLLVDDLPKTQPASLQLIEIDKGVALRKGDIYLLTKEVKANAFADETWQNDKKTQHDSAVFETHRTLMAVSNDAPPEFLQMVRAKKGGYSRYDSQTNRFWDDLRESTAIGGKLTPSGFPYYIFHRPDWRHEKNWHFSFFLNYTLKMKDKKFTVTIMPKEYGGLWRLQTALRETTGGKNQLLLGTGNITPVGKDSYRNTLEVLNQFGPQSVAAGVREIIGKKQVIDRYNASWNGRPPIQFLSANIYEKRGSEETLVFKPYEFIDIAGKKIAIIGFSSFDSSSEIEKASTRDPWLKQIVIKKPEEVFNRLFSEVRPQADFIILLTNMTKKELGVAYQELEGIDLVVQQSRRLYSLSGRTTTESKDYKSRLPRTPMMVVPTGDTYINLIHLELDQKNTKLSSNQKILGQNINSDGYDPENYETDDLSSLFAGKDIVLPDYREIHPDKFGASKEEFANLAAELMRKRLDGEIGIFNIQNQRSDMPGELDAYILKSWIREDEQLMVVYMLGKDISALLESNKTAQDPHRLAFAGIDDKGMFAGTPLQSGEVYRVITSTAVGDNDQAYPSTANAIGKASRFVKVDDRYQEHIGGESISLIDFLTGTLRDEWTASAKLSPEARHQKYRDLYEGKSYLKRKGYWVHDFKSLRLEYSTLKTTDLTAFQNVNDSRLSAADQRLIGVGVNYAAIYRKKPYISELGIKGQFSKIEFNPDSADAIENVLIDDLVYSANIGWPVFNLDSRLSALAVQSGPIFELAYDTEFEKDPGLELEKNLQSFLGWRFYDGSWFHSITLAALNENRLTKSNEKNAWGYNVRFEIARPLYPDLAVWRSDFDYRYFFNTDKDTSQDLESRLIWDNFLDISIFGKLSFGPYFKWAVFNGQTFNQSATQTTVGVNFNFSSLWKPKYQKTPF